VLEPDVPMDNIRAFANAVKAATHAGSRQP
jgi:hypothetical protein